MSQPKNVVPRGHKFSQLSAVLISMSLLGTAACAERAGTKKNAKVTKKASAEKGAKSKAKSDKAAVKK